MKEATEGSNQPEASSASSGTSDIDGILASIEATPVKSKEETAVSKEKEARGPKNILNKDLQEAPGSIEAEIAAMMKENGEVEDAASDEDTVIEDDQESEESAGDEKESEDDLDEIIYNGKAEKLTRDQLKELAQKGKDYTQKTQALAEDKNKFIEEKKLAEKELNEYYAKLEERDNQSATKLAMLEKWDIAIDLMKEQNPDLFAEVSAFYNNSSRQYDNPVMNRKFESQQKEIEALKEQLLGKKHSDIRASFDNDLTKTRNELGSKLESLGVFPDWEGKVKDAWTNSGVDSVKSAVYAIYGDQIRAASESRNKLLESQLNARNKKTIKGAPGARSTNQGEVNLHKEDWGKLTRMALASLKNN